MLNVREGRGENTCSRSGTALGGCGPATLFWVTCLERARTAVTFVMKLSSGSTLALVTLMMNASHVTLSSFSSSFLLSTCHIPPHFPLDDFALQAWSLAAAISTCFYVVSQIPDTCQPDQLSTSNPNPADPLLYPKQQARRCPDCYAPASLRSCCKQLPSWEGLSGSEVDV